MAKQKHPMSQVANFGSYAKKVMSSDKENVSKQFAICMSISNQPLINFAGTTHLTGNHRNN
jgi:hypothetical protein